MKIFFGENTNLEKSNKIKPDEDKPSKNTLNRLININQHKQEKKIFINDLKKLYLKKQGARLIINIDKLNYVFSDGSKIIDDIGNLILIIVRAKLTIYENSTITIDGELIKDFHLRYMQIEGNHTHMDLLEKLANDYNLSLEGGAEKQFKDINHQQIINQNSNNKFKQNNKQNTSNQTSKSLDYLGKTNSPNLNLIRKNTEFQDIKHQYNQQEATTVSIDEYNSYKNFINIRERLMIKYILFKTEKYRIKETINNYGFDRLLDNLDRHCHGYIEEFKYDIIQLYNHFKGFIISLEESINKEKPINKETYINKKYDIYLKKSFPDFNPIQQTDKESVDLNPSYTPSYRIRTNKHQQLQSISANKGIRENTNSQPPNSPYSKQQSQITNQNLTNYNI